MELLCSAYLWSFCLLADGGAGVGSDRRAGPRPLSLPPLGGHAPPFCGNCSVLQGILTCWFTRGLSLWRWVCTGTVWSWPFHNTHSTHSGRLLLLRSPGIVFWTVRSWQLPTPSPLSATSTLWRWCWLYLGYFQQSTRLILCGRTGWTLHTFSPIWMLWAQSAWQLGAWMHCTAYRLFRAMPKPNWQS